VILRFNFFHISSACPPNNSWLSVPLLLPVSSQYSTARYPLPYFISIANMSLPESNGKTILVTGINGYIASVLGLDLLSKGYSLRGTSRRAASAASLLQGPFAPYADRVTIFEVPDMTIDGAFDEAAKGIISQTQPIPSNSRYRSTR